MTKEQLQQKTSRGETFGELLRRALIEDGQPAAMIAAQTETEISAEENSDDGSDHS